MFSPWYKWKKYLFSINSLSSIVRLCCLKMNNTRLNPRYVLSYTHCDLSFVRLHLVFVVFCRSLFGSSCIIFLSAIAVFVLWITVSDYPLVSSNFSFLLIFFYWSQTWLFLACKCMILIVLRYIIIQTALTMCTLFNIFESKFKMYTIWTTFKT